MDGLARRLAGGLRDIFTQRGLPYAVVQQESIVDFKFRAGPPAQNYDDARSADRAAFARYCAAMLERGVLLAPSQNEVMFLSTAHTAQDVDETLAAEEFALGEAAGAGVSRTKNAVASATGIPKKTTCPTRM